MHSPTRLIDWLIGNRRYQTMLVCFVALAVYRVLQANARLSEAVAQAEADSDEQRRQSDTAITELQAVSLLIRMHAPTVPHRCLACWNISNNMPREESRTPCPAAAQL